MHRFANPARFARFSAAIRPWMAGMTGVALLAGLWLAFIGSPPDYQQGETVRIMYIHVPSAWMALFLYASMGGAAISALIWRHPLADLWVRAAAPVGALFTAICLVTGSLWGLPTWGTWWVWDARLTSVLILFFLYIGYMLLSSAYEERHRGDAAGRLLVIAGLVNLPIIKFSVDWWNTLHQPASIARIGSPAIDPSMLWPLLTMTAAVFTGGLLLVLLRLETERLERKLAGLAARGAAQADVPSAIRVTVSGAPTPDAGGKKDQRARAPSA